MKPSIGKSIGAVAAGFVAAAGLSVGTDALMHATGIFPPVGVVMANGLFVLATAYRFVFQSFGGYLTARIAAARPMKHVLILAGIGQVLSLFGILAWKAMGPAGGPLWYPLALVVTAIPSVWIGGWIQQRRQEPAI